MTVTVGGGAHAPIVIAADWYSWALTKKASSACPGSWYASNPPSFTRNERISSMASSFWTCMRPELELWRVNVEERVAEAWAGEVVRGEYARGKVVGGIYRHLRNRKGWVARLKRLH